jgi:hypothetical protein
MIKRMAGVWLSALLAGQAWGNSLTVSGLLDAEDGRSMTVAGRYAPVEALTLGASIGHSRSRLEGSDEQFSGNTVGAAADLTLGAFFIGASADRWKDSGQLRSTTLHGEAGWMSNAGVALAALVTHRAMRVHYTNTVLGVTRERQIDFKGTGLGADLSYYGEAWTAGVAFLTYDYGQNVQRVRSVLESSNTQRFPRLEQLIGSVATRAAGAPDRELSLALGRQFTHLSLQASVQWQRDALTAEESRSAGLTLGLRPGKHFGVDLSAGASKGDETDTIGWVGLALTLRSAK